MRIVVAPAPFKECAPALTIARFIRRAIRRTSPTVQIDELELTDGGTGFTDWVVRNTEGTFRWAYAQRLDGVVIPVRLGLTSSKTAVVDCAAVIGLAHIPPSRREPLAYSSFGLGELIRRALDLGLEHVVVGCGDSGNCDGGLGLAAALGFRFLDRKGRMVRPVALNMDKIDLIDDSNVHSRLESAQITVVCNTAYSWAGRTGATSLFGRQKGLQRRQIEELELSFLHLGDVFAKFGRDPSSMPGAGASGGICGVLGSLCGAHVVHYANFLERYVDVADSIRGADLVLTGEGCVDSQTLLGKLPVYVARKAQESDTPCVAIVGQCNLDPGETSLFKEVLVLSEEAPADAMLYPSSLEQIENVIASYLGEVAHA